MFAENIHTKRFSSQKVKNHIAFFINKLSSKICFVKIEKIIPRFAREIFAKLYKIYNSNPEIYYMR